ncbi:MAG: FCD domain-containing protein [Blastomonas fulva]|uniref:FadR/GntR family transcriptional regulator n=1 Tax=Blastomonas fulva TaxID=1550728 RepID=UPI0024E1FFD8|nr:FCD domain-containing protein [Blastomonas fulva]MDK2756063.1 FCD domain-containing protein [Blastomonas fulva]
MEKIDQPNSKVSILAESEVPKPGTRIRVPKTSEIVADHFRGQIVRGELKEGDFLPPEGQLMTTLGISRPTLREAFRILEAESLISVVRGSRTGARVHQPSIELVSRYAGYVLQSMGTTIADLYQARLAIEPQVVRWLATKPERAAIKRLRNEIERLRVLLLADRFDAFIDAVSEFHGALVEVSGTQTLTFMNQLLLNLMARHQSDYKRRHPLDYEQQKKRLHAGLKSYEKLVDLIESGEVEGAVKHWRLHLSNANQTWAEETEGARIVDSLGQ